MFTDLLNRMQSLLQREDIQVILNSVGETAGTAKASQASGTLATPEAPKPEPIDFNVS